MVPRTSAAGRRPPRRGAILLVVLAMLALFAVIGLSFVLYAESAATSAQASMEGFSTTTEAITSSGTVTGGGGMDPQRVKAAANDFLTQFLYPVPDTDNVGSGEMRTLSALRGHEMARMVYGYNVADPSGNSIAYNGVGAIHDTISPAIGTLNDRAQVINFTSASGTVTSGKMFDPEHTGTRDTTGVGTAPTTTYFGKNAAYTYPDRNNASVSVVDPNTGRVIIPSYHRPTLFDLNTTAGTGDWISTEGRFKILRPRPADHDPTFPYPPKNPDGTVTGDVQNLRWAHGMQRNDSVWLYTGAKPFTWQGKTVVPLVAPIVLPLDGRINLNVAGNLKGPSQTHASNQGFGPWEIDLTNLLQSGDLAKLIKARFGNTAGTVPNPAGVTPAAGYSVKYFHPDPANPTTAGFAPPSKSKVDWDGAATTSTYTAKMQVPYSATLYPSTVGAFVSDPFWPGKNDTGIEGPYDNSDLVVTPGPPLTVTGEAYQHPSLWNSYERDRNPTTADRSFPLRDMQLLAGRYSGTAAAYSTTYLGSPSGPLAASVGGGTLPGSNPNSTAANARRQLLTSISNSLKRPGLAPMTFGASGHNFQLPPADIATFIPPKLAATTSLSVGAVAAAAGASDVRNNATAPHDVRAFSAALGAVDVNRPLADYRDDLTAPLKVGNVTTTTFNAATADRQRLAGDIFARLIVASGAGTVSTATTGTTFGSATVHPVTGVVTILADPNTQPQEYNGLRWLAQLAVNIVDYVDNDDISTPFRWNSNTAYNVTSLADPALAEVTKVGLSFVFGVEKPRLVINEAYAEVANEKSDTGTSPGYATKAFKLRYFIELLNTGVTLSGSGAAQDPLAGPDTSKLGSVAFRSGAIAPYKLEIYQNDVSVATGASVLERLLMDSSNVMGALPTDPANPKAFKRVDTNFTSGFTGTDNIEPNDGQFKVTSATARNGFAVLCSPNAVSTSNQGGDTKGLYLSTAQMGEALQSTALEVETDNPKVEPPVKASQIGTSVVTPVRGDAERHVVLLRRLACPYLAESATNPYVTVDVQARVPVNDAIWVGNDPNTADMTNEGDRSSQPDNPDVTTHQSVGRVQPYTAAGNPALSFPATMVMFQKAVDAAGTTPQANTKQHTLFRHNAVIQTGAADPPTTVPVSVTGTIQTLNAPFNWLTHLDRGLVNPAELLQVAAVKPHELTTRFATPGIPSFHTHDARAAGMIGTVDQATGAAAGTQSPLYRALELLTVKPWTYNTPEGGRTAGRVNINMIWDQDPVTGRSKIFDAILNKQSANKFDPTNAGEDTNVIWQALRDTRSPKWQPNLGDPSKWVGTTFHEDTTTGADRPIRSLGTAMLSGTGSLINPTGIEDTILRPRSDGQPLFWRVPTTPPLHPYEAAEPLSKVLNNLTTVSDTYLVVFTVGFFEVRNPTATFSATTPPILGVEAFSSVPGDLRSQYVAVVDRTQFTRPVMAAAPAPTGWTAAEQTMTVPATAPASLTEATVRLYDRSYTVKPGTSLMIGDGPSPELVAVGSASSDGTTATIKFTPLIAHPAGTPAIIRDQQGPPLWATEAVGDATTGQIKASTTPTTLRILAKSATATEVTIRYEGEDIKIKAGSLIRIGTGVGSEWVTVSGVSPPVPPFTGIATLNVPSLARDHAPGDAVTGALAGNPGPQAVIDLSPTNPNANKYKPLVPYFEQISP